jgi:hypothetical protein
MTVTQAKKKVLIDNIKVWSKFKWFPSAVKKQFLEKNSASPKMIKLWLSFKFFFQVKQKSHFFSRFKWFYNNIRVMKKYYTQFYGLKSNKNLKSKRSFCLKKSSNKLYIFLKKIRVSIRFNISSF